ncbi:MAG: hypothetical protein GHCLOJNM_00821 [bacterium]|nr:hypothetical protein [bacterium]
MIAPTPATVSETETTDSPPPLPRRRPEGSGWRVVPRMVLLALSGLLAAFAQALMAYRESALPILKEKLGDWAPTLEFLPAFCLPALPTSVALLCALLSVIPALALGWRLLENKIEAGEASTPPEEPRTPLLSAGLAWSQVQFFAALSLVFLAFALGATATRPRNMEEGWFKWLFVNTTGSMYSPYAGPAWILAMLSALMAGLFADLRLATWPRLRGRASEWLFVFALTLLAIGYYMHDLTHWRYSIIGDEYAFYFHSEVQAKADRVPIFSEKGVYGTHPELSTLAQAWLMRYFGFTATNWRLPSVLSAALCIAPIYAIARMLVGVRAAVAAALLWAFAHYNVSFAHIPYNNNQVMFPLVTSLALFLWARIERSLMLFCLCGIVAGIGFYTFFSARVAVVAVALHALVYYSGVPTRKSMRSVGLALAFSLGLVVTTLPIFRNPVAFLSLAINQTAFAQHIANWKGEAKPVEGRLGIYTSPESFRRLKENTVQSLLLPLSYEARRASVRHYVSGGLVDRVSSALGILGLAYMFVWGWKRRWLAFLLSYLATLGVVGMISAGEYPLITRMLILVPFVVIAAAVGLEKLHLLVESTLGSLPAVCFSGILVASALGLNVRQNQVLFYRQPTAASGSYVLALAQESLPDTHVYYLLPEGHNEVVIIALMHMSGFKDRFTFIRSTPETGAPEPLKRPALIALNEFHPHREAILQRIQAQYPESKLHEYPGSLEGSLWVLEIGDSGWTPPNLRKDDDGS